MSAPLSKKERLELKNSLADKTIALAAKPPTTWNEEDLSNLSEIIQAGNDDKLFSSDELRYVANTLKGKAVLLANDNIKAAASNCLWDMAVINDNEQGEEGPDIDLQTKLIVEAIACVDARENHEETSTIQNALDMMKNAQNLGLSEEQQALIGQSIFSILSPEKNNQFVRAKLLHVFRNNMIEQMDEDIWEATSELNYKFGKNKFKWREQLRKIANAYGEEENLIFKQTTAKEMKDQALRHQIATDALSLAML